MRRVKKNSRDLAIGDKFYWTATSKVLQEVLAQGPAYFAMGDTLGIETNPHLEVWVEAPARSTVGDFEVGERFRTLSTTFEVLFKGERRALLRNIYTGAECSLGLDQAVAEVPE